MNFRSCDPVGAEASMLASAVPSGFSKLSDRLQQSIDRQLGYFGQDRFVMFYYEPRGAEVVWTDSQSCGFGTGGWRIFLDEIEPIARQDGADLGTAETRGRHGMVVDREYGRAYYADQGEARAFLAQQRRAMSA